jgi:hypothetical protein
MGIGRWYPLTITREPQWEVNDRFEILSGHKFFINGYLRFPINVKHPNKMPMKYRTNFGYSFAHSGVMYDNNAINLTHALSRHMKKKVPEPLELEVLTNFEAEEFDQFLENSKRNWYSSPDRAVCLDILLKYYGIHQYQFNIIEAAYLLSLEPHPKIKARKSDIKNMENSNKWNQDLWSDFISWFIKFLEIAKFLKDPRLVVDCNMSNSMSRVHFAQSYKNFISAKRIQFSEESEMFYGNKVDPVSIADYLEEIETTQLRILLINNSDDACLSLDNRKYNLDIISNDSTHSYDTYLFYKDVSNMPEDSYKHLLSIISAPIRIDNPSNSKGTTNTPKKNNQKVYLRSKTGYLPSGLGDTTICNNLIYPVLVYNLTKIMIEKKGTKLTPHDVVRAGLNFGFRFSCEECYIPQDLQYLKMSLSNSFPKLGIPNLGILLRYSGLIEGDVPKFSRFNSNLKLRIEYFQSLLTYGFFKSFYYKPLIRLCPMYEYLHSNQQVYYQDIILLRDLVNQHLQYTSVQRNLTSDDIYMRYNLTPTQILVFEELVSKTGYGNVIYCELVDIVLLKDYGLKW